MSSGGVVFVPSAASECRTVFLKVVGRRPLSARRYGSCTTRACARNPAVGPHRLRHTAATGMLREGASLAKIGQVLRNRSEQTTAATRRSTARRSDRSRCRGRR